MRNKQRTSSRFWLISAALHGAALVVVVLTPAGQRVFKSEDRPLKPEIIRKDEALAEVIDNIRDLSVERLKTQVALLEAGRARMATNFETLNRHYQPFVAEQLASSRARLAQEAEKTFALQQEVLAAAKRALELNEPGAGALGAVFDKNRAALLAGQGEIRRALMLAAADDEALLAAQEQAETVQVDALQSLSLSVNARKHLNYAASQLAVFAGKKAQLETELNEAAANARELETELERMRDEEPALTAGLKDAQQNVAALKKALDQARRAKTGEAAAREALKAAEGALREAQQAVNTLKERRKAADWKLKAALRTVGGRKKSIEWNARDAGRVEATVPPKVLERDTNAEKVVTLQERALALQKDIYARLVARLEKQESESAKNETETKEAQP